MSASEITRSGVKAHLSNVVVSGGVAYLAGVTPATGTTVAEQTKSVLDQISSRVSCIQCSLPVAASRQCTLPAYSAA